MAHLASLLFAIVAIAFMALAAVMNWRFGLTLGRSGFDQMLFAAVGVGVDIAKMLLPFVLYWAVKNRRVLVALLAAIALAAVVSYSLAGLAGYVDLARAAVTGTVTSKKGNASDLRAELQRKQSQLAGLGIGEPQSVIERRLAILQQDARWSSSRQCTNATVHSSRNFCADYRKVEAELAAARAAKQLTSEIAHLRGRLGDLAAVEAVEGNDPRVDVMARLWGWNKLATQTWLGLLLVGIIEFMSTFGIFIAFNHGEIGGALKGWQKSRKRKSIRNPAAPQDPIGKPPPIEAPNDGPIDEEPELPAIDDEREIGDVVMFALATMQPEQGSEVDIAALHPAYVTWCSSNDLRPLDAEDFVETFTVICDAVELPRREQNGRTICMDMRLAA